MYSNWFRKRYRGKVSFEEVLGGAEHAKQLEFGTTRFDHVIASPFTRRTVSIGIVGIVILAVVLIAKTFQLSVVDGELYRKRAEQNSFHADILFAPRGLIVDRNGLIIAGNDTATTTTDILRRTVRPHPGYGNLIGYVQYPKKDSSGYFWRVAIEGVSGIEQLFNKTLIGQNGYQYTEEHARADATTTTTPDYSFINPPVPGKSVRLTIDARIQDVLGDRLEQYRSQFGYTGGAGVIIDIHSGEILASVSVPDIDPVAMSDGSTEVITQYLNDTRSPLLNRVVFGGFSAGSTVKPYIALAALNEGLITPDTTIISTGKITVPNPYNPDQPSYFRDWRKEGHGPTNVTHALADSVNTFFYAIGGGYGSQRGLGINRINTYMELFGMGEPVQSIFTGKQPGQIPNPQWKLVTFREAWRLGDTYNSSIGQYGFVVTPLQQVRAVAALANGGTLIDPVLIPGAVPRKTVITGIDQSWFTTIRSAMRATVTDGTARTLNVSYTAVAAKTGTAQVKSGQIVHSWVVGFWPYESPRYAFVVMGERGPAEGTINASWVMRQVLDWMSVHTPEYFVTDAGGIDTETGTLEAAGIP